MLECDRIDISERIDINKTNEKDKYTEIYLKKIRINRENMEETNIVICLKDRNKDQKNIKKITVRLKTTNIIINNKIVLIVHAVTYINKTY